MNVRAEITEATPLPLPRDARIAHTFSEMEGTIHDAVNMAGLAMRVFDDAFKSPQRNGGVLVFTLTEEHFEKVAFAITLAERLTRNVFTEWNAGFEAAREGGAA